MSKKKNSGNTMTLKDFHGGSIPTDLPLPSAPGLTVRSSDRSGFDRPSSWGNPIGRPEHRSRPHTSPVTRHYDDKTPFLTHTVQIGRNFDEDERKPLDGVSAPRRTINDESIRVSHARVEVKPEYGQGGSSLGRQVAPVSPSPGAAVNSYSGRLSEAIHSGVNSQNLGGGSVQGTGGGYPNAWAMRKEVASAVEPEQSATAWSAPYAASKLAHASAIEKVSSGRWQSKTVHYQTDELVRSSEVENVSGPGVNGNNAYNRMDTVGEKEYYDAMLERHAERGLGIDDRSQGGRHELLNHEGSGVSRYSEVRSRSVGYNTDEVQLVRNDAKLGGSELQHPMPSEQKERPKLKLFPRTKPLENFEPSVTDNTQGHRWISDSGNVETVNEVNVHTNFVKPVSAGTESGKEVAHRPKLNLKPRSQPLEQLEGNSERGRDSLFGGARPRELVLKERGMDDVVNNYDVVEHSNRAECHIVRAEKLSDQSAQIRHVEKTEYASVDQRAGRNSDRKDQRLDAERGNAQRKNWRGGDNRRNTRETERQQQQVFERHTSPETWRKPVEQPKPSSGDAGAPYGKSASAVDLAQAFSRSVSDPKSNERLTSQRVLNSGRPQIPFSRLVGPTPRPSINGY